MFSYPCSGGFFSVQFLSQRVAPKFLLSASVGERNWKTFGTRVAKRVSFQFKLSVMFARLKTDHNRQQRRKQHWPGDHVTRSLHLYLPCGPGAGALPYMGYIGLCGPKGYGFSAGLVKIRVSILGILAPFR